MRDISQAIRSLRRSPGFSATAFVTLALGIGAATTVFSVTDGLLFKPLPYADAHRLVTVGADVRARGQSNWGVYAPEFDAWRSSSPTLADLAGWQTFGRFTLALPEAPVEISVNRITPNFLHLLGRAPAIGRPFGDADFVPGATLAMLLTDRTWKRVFGGDRSAIGRFITVNGAPAEIAGVLPRDFAFPAASAASQADALVPLVRTKESASSGLSMIGRLAAGRSIDEARLQIDELARSRAAETFMRNARVDGATVMPLNEALRDKSQSILRLLVGAVAVLLLMGCVNVANLLLARGTERRGEIAVRVALGASRRSLLRLLLTESLVLAMVGCAAGTLLAYAAVGVIGPLIPPDLQRLGEASVNVRALLFAVGASLCTVVLAGLGPALTAARGDASPSLVQTSGRTTGARWRVRQVLIGFEAALAVVLLVGGGLMISSIVRVLGVDTGYTSTSVLTMRVQLPRGTQYPKRSQQFVERVLTAARGVPGVTHAGASDGRPLGNTLYAGHYRVEGFSYDWMAQDVPKTGACCVQTQWVSPGFFDAAGIQLVRGRAFTSSDAAGAPAVALIGERLAGRFPPGTDPIGYYLTSAEEGSKDRSDRRLIVGVVRDVRDMHLERAALPSIYLPMEERGSAAMTLMVRTSVRPESIAGAVEKALRQAVGPVLVTDVLPLDEVMKRSVGPRRLNAWLFGSFAVLALLLAATGIGSVVFYSVARRTREMGVRLALGAQPADVRRMVVVESMVPVAAGLGVGVVAALMLSRFVESFLFGVPPRDVTTYVAACVLLLTAGVIAALLPARRAARVDPLVALRAE